MNNYHFAETQDGKGILQKQVEQPGQQPTWENEMETPMPFFDIATRQYVKDKVAEADPDFKGTYTSMSDIEAISPVNANDWAYLQTTDSSGNAEYSRYRYTRDNGWTFEICIKRDNFTDEEWAAITSGITSGKVERLDEIDELVGDQVLQSIEHDNDGNVIGVYKALESEEQEQG